MRRRGRKGFRPEDEGRGEGGGFRAAGCEGGESGIQGASSPGAGRELEEEEELVDGVAWECTGDAYASGE